MSVAPIAERDRCQPVHTGIAADGRSRRRVGRDERLDRVARALQEPFDVRGEEQVRSAFGVAGGVGLSSRDHALQLVRRLSAHLWIGRSAGQPHHAIHEHALFGAADFLLVGCARRGFEDGLGEPVDDFPQPRQRGIFGVLGHHAGGAIQL